MKNVKLLQPDIIHADIIFTYGTKSYKKLMAVRYNNGEVMGKHPVTTVYDSYKDLPYTIVVSIKKLKHYRDEVSLRASLVHEISHATTYIMKRFNFDCDEFRSYTMEWLYDQISIFLNERIEKESK